MNRSLDHRVGYIGIHNVQYGMDHLISTDAQDGIHFAFMKILPQSAERYVTYDYFDLNLGLFFGNASVTESRRTGWGRVRNGKNDEALISLHADPSELWQDAGEANYSFSSWSDVSVNPGVFAGFGRAGDTADLIALGF